MDPRQAAKIMKEFKTPEEISRVQMVMERIRQAQSDAAATQPASPSASLQPSP
jgi:hypothetical protein